VNEAVANRYFADLEALMEAVERRWLALQGDRELLRRHTLFHLVTRSEGFCVKGYETTPGPELGPWGAGAVDAPLKPPAILQGEAERSLGREWV